VFSAQQLPSHVGVLRVITPLIKFFENHRAFLRAVLRANGRTDVRLTKPLFERLKFNVFFPSGKYHSYFLLFFAIFIRRIEMFPFATCFVICKEPFFTAFPGVLCPRDRASTEAKLTRFSR